MNPTIRTRLLDRVGPEDGRGSSSEDDELAEAVYDLMRGDPELPLSVDGWVMFRVVEETEATLRAVGVMAVLPADDCPMEVELKWEADAISYSLRLGVVGAGWWAKSEAKRWKAVHLYSTGERGPEWTWTDPWHGRVAARRSAGS
jgi:hypothetical protein